MTHWYSTSELTRMRQQEMVQRADHYRLVQLAKTAARRNAALDKMEQPDSLYRKVILFFQRSRTTSFESGTRPLQAGSQDVAHRIVDLDGVDDLAVQVHVAPSNPDLPPLRRLQAEVDLSPDLRDQLKDQLLNVQE